MADARDGEAEVLARAEAVLLASDRSRVTWECGAGGAGRARLPRAAAFAPIEPSIPIASSPATRMAPRALFRTPSRAASGKVGNYVRTADGAGDEALLRRAESILDDHARFRAVWFGRGDEKEMKEETNKNIGELHAGGPDAERALLCRMLCSWGWHVRAKSRAARHEERVLEKACGVLDAVAENKRMRLAEELEKIAQQDAEDWQAAAAFRCRCLAKVILTALLTSALLAREVDKRAAEFRAQQARRCAWRWWIKALAEFRAASEAQARVAERKAKLEALVKGFSSTSARHDAPAQPATAKVAARSNCSMQAGSAAGRKGLPRANVLQFSCPATTKSSGEALRAGVCSGSKSDQRGALWCKEEAEVAAQENTNTYVGGLGTHVRREILGSKAAASSDNSSGDVEAQGIAAGGVETHGITGLHKHQRQAPPQHAPGNVQPSAEHASVVAMRQREMSRKAARMALKVSFLVRLLVSSFFLCPLVTRTEECLSDVY